MANIKSQIKRNKQAEAARERNKAVKSNIKTEIKKFDAAALVGIDEAKTRLHAVVVALDKAASDKVIHKNEAARKKSTLTKKFNAVVKNPPAPVVEDEKPAKIKKAAKTAKTSKSSAATKTAKPTKKPATKKTAAKKTAAKK